MSADSSRRDTELIGGGAGVVDSEVGEAEGAGGGSTEVCGRGVAAGRDFLPPQDMVKPRQKQQAMGIAVHEFPMVRR